MTKKKNQLETYLDRVHVDMRIKGAGLVFKVPTPVEGIRPKGGGRVEGRLGKAVWTDYAGCLWDGRAVCGEAKELRKKTANLTHARLPQHQKDALSYVGESGGVAWIFCRRIWEGEVTDYLVPVTSAGMFTSSIKLLPKYVKPSGMQLQDAAVNWYGYAKDGWAGVTKWKP